MKKVLCLCAGMLAAALCAGCGAELPPAFPTEPPAAALTSPAPMETPVPTKTPAPTPTPEPEGELAVARADGVGAVFTLLDRGFSANIAGEQGEFYQITVDGTAVLVEKRFVRLDSDAAYESWTGYVKGKAEVYDNAYLEGDPIAALKQNTKITVLDAPGDLLLISWEEFTGYLPAAKISKKRISSGGSGGHGGSGGGGGGGGQDGGDIQLSLMPGYGGEIVRLTTPVREASAPISEGASPAFPCAGTVIADGVEAYLMLFSRGDTVKVIDSDETNYRVLTEQGIGTVPKRLIRLISEAAFEEWDGFSDNKASFCSDYRMQNEIEKLKRNAKIRVLDDLGDCYLVETNGKTGCILKTKASEKKYKTPSSSGGHGGGGGGGGGQEWTDPAL